MSIASIAKKQANRHEDPIKRAAEEAAAHATLSSAYQAAVKTYGAKVAGEWLEKQHGQPPTVAETQAAELEVQRADFRDLRAQNPFAAAFAAKANSALAYAPGASATTTNDALREAQRLPVGGESPPDPDPFATARARVAAAPPVRDPASAAWVSTNLEGGK
jgi:hypothetical protein